MKTTPILALTCLCGSLAGSAAASVLVEIQDLGPGDVQVRGFRIERPQEVRVRATGLVGRTRYSELSAAWIVHTESRAVVWRMEDPRPAQHHRVTQDVEATVRLAAGVYEAYYATYPKCCPSGDSLGWWEKATQAVTRFLGANPRNTLDELKLLVKGADDGAHSLSDELLKRSHDELRERSLVSLMGQDDGMAKNRGFVLARPVELEVYCVGELTVDGSYDYGWIIDAETKRKVWSFTYKGSQEAGGAEKNRQVRQSLPLKAGSYAAFFVTDGSHSPNNWNVLPPDDPVFWGMTLTVKDAGQRQYAKTFDYSHQPDEQVIAELTRLRNDQYRSRGVTVAAPVAVRVYALGEGGKGGMVDYGWIAEARTRKKIWSMSYDRTVSAGGSPKNRLADEILHLQPGSYVLTFVTDDSHAYPKWNASPPPEPERWGISLFAVGKDFDPATVTPYLASEDPAEDPAILARIARVRDHRHERRDFALERDAEIFIYAVGEGLHGEMYDYGWVENRRTGRLVWKMTHGMTRGAGGHPKNRVYEGVVELEAGSYTLHYQTDGSHSFGAWNVSPPGDPEGWGIRVVRVAE